MSLEHLAEIGLGQACGGTSENVKLISLIDFL